MSQRASLSFAIVVFTLTSASLVGCDHGSSASGTDAGTPDGSTDAGTPDGSTDAGTPDGSTDAGTTELSAPLASTPTLGTTSQGQVDALGLGFYIATAGVFPTPAGGVNTSGTPYLGQIMLFAGNFTPSGFHACDGTLLPIASNTALFSLLGTTYGGDGQTTFALPDLRGRVPLGIGAIAGATTPPSGTGVSTVPVVTGVTLGLLARGQVEGLGLEILIATEGVFPSSGGTTTDALVGSLLFFAGNFAPGGYVPCDGRTLDIATYSALFNLLGTTYGGDGQTTFAVPDLRARSPMGPGPTSGASVPVPAAGAPQIPLVASIELGATATGQIGVLGLGAYLREFGVFPSQGGGSGSDANVASLLFFAGNFAPGGFLACDGTTRAIAGDTALFSLLGTTYGGDGQTTFALPDLSSRVVVGAN